MYFKKDNIIVGLLKNLLKKNRFCELCIEEFRIYYEIIEVFKNENPDTYKEVEEKIIAIQSKYDKLKRQVLGL